MVPLSVLDLSPIVEGSDAAQALRNTLDLAQHVETWGYRRYWMAEHHNMDGVASSATAVLVGHVAGGTKTMRVGSGGVMLPNHAPLVIAEQFGTLATLYPDRIDLGLGRAPGTDGLTMRALRRRLDTADEDHFLHDVQELQAYLDDPHPDQRVRAVPGMGTKVPIWLLGSSLFSAQLAAMLGLPFAFASHFAPDHLEDALAIYRDRFQPSAQLERPYVMLGVNVFAAATDAEARRNFTSLQQAFVNLRSGRPGALPPPVDSTEGLWSPMEQAGLAHSLRYAIVGAPATVERGLAAFIREHEADEMMVTAQMFDHAARRRSFEIVAEVRDRLAATAPSAACA